MIDFENTRIGKYIRYIENKDSLGWNNDKKAWYKPTKRGTDSNNRGFGIDIKYNKSASKIASGRPGKYLTEAEERKERNNHLNYVYDVLLKQLNKTGKTLSDKKTLLILGLLYRGDGGIGFWNGDIWKNAFVENDDDFQKRIENYYKNTGIPERANKTKSFYLNEYYNWLEKEAEKNAIKWGIDTDSALTLMANDNTYNYYEYWLSDYQKSSNGHYPDTFKTVYHPTFSTDSKYSGNISQYNPSGIVGGTWEDIPENKYSMIKGFYHLPKLSTPVSIVRTQRYLEDNDSGWYVKYKSGGKLNYLKFFK